MDPKNKKPESSSSDWFDEKNTRAEFDPFARDMHSASEIQADEKKESENHPGTEPAIPGNLPPERTVQPLPERPVNPQPEIPGETGRNAPEIVKLPGTDTPEWQAPSSPELPPEQPALPKADGKPEEKVVFPSLLAEDEQ